MVRGEEEIRRRITEVVEKFREKGALSPEKALTAQELGLPPQFERAMHRRLGQLRIFVEVNGKYYLDEERLRQVQEFLRKRDGAHSWSRYAGILLMLPIGLIVSLALFYLLVFSGVSFFPGGFLAILTIVMVVVAVIRILFWRSKRRYWREQW
jgi:predicted phage tail protein